jgi:hypothetical protein
MLKLTLLVIVEAVIGIAAAAVLLAVIVPLLIRRHFIAPGDLSGSVLIGVVLILAVGAMLLRPGSALNRHGKRDQ